MQVSTMRSLDRYIGIPLCFLMDIVWVIASFFRSHKKREPDLSRTLFIELSEMGSAVLVDPAMRYLKEKQGSELFFVIFASNAESLDILETVARENRFYLRMHNLLVLAIDVVRFMRWCRRKQITAVIDLELFSRFTALLTVLSGASHRCGFYAHFDEGFYRGHLLNYPVRYNAHVHISINFMSLVHSAMGYHKSPYPITPVEPERLIPVQARISAEEINASQHVLDQLFPAWRDMKIVLFNTNASDLLPQRQWMENYFVELAGILLRERADVLVVAIGSEEEQKEVQAIVDEVNDNRCCSLAGKTHLRQLLALYHQATCLLSNDSGPAQFAAVTPLKTFVVFGPETPDLYRPLGHHIETFYLALPCSPCVSASNHRKTNCTNRQCLSGIYPQKVSKALLDYLHSLDQDT